MAAMWKEVVDPGEDDAVDSVEHDLVPDESDDPASNDELQVARSKRTRSVSLSEDSDVPSWNPRIKTPSGAIGPQPTTASTPPTQRSTRRSRRMKRQHIRASSRISTSCSPRPLQSREMSRDDLALAMGVKASQESYQNEQKMGPAISDEQREEMEVEMAIQISLRKHEATKRGERQSRGLEERPTSLTTSDSGTVCAENELSITAKSSKDITDGSCEDPIDRMGFRPQDAGNIEHISGERLSLTPGPSATSGSARVLMHRALTPPAPQGGRAAGTCDEQLSDLIQRLRADNAEMKEEHATLLKEKAASSKREAAFLMREEAYADREANLLRRVIELEKELEDYKDVVFLPNAT